MRVVGIVHKWPPLHNAGAELMLETMFRDLVERGHEVVVLLFDQDLAPYKLHGITVIKVKPRYLEQFAAWSDVIFTHLDKTQLAVQAAQGAGRPLVHVVHNERQLAFHYVRPEDATLIVPNSEWLAAELDWPGAQVIVRPPVRVDDYEGIPTDPYGREFVTLVNVTLEKGSTRFYDLARAFPKRKFLAVSGAYGLQDVRRVPFNVTVLNHTASIRDEVYARTRVLLMPSDYESWGRVAIEGACSGIPTIAHPTPGLTEALGSSGFLIDRADGSAWERVLVSLDDPRIYRERSEAALDRAADLATIAGQDLERLHDALVELVRSAPADRSYDAPMTILSSTAAGMRCPLCGHAGCACTPDAGDVYERLKADQIVDDVTVNAAVARGPLRTYRTALGDFRLDEVDAKRDGLLDAGDKPVMTIMTRMAQVMAPADLDLFVARYEGSYGAARQEFLSELALIDRWRTAENLERLLDLLTPLEASDDDEHPFGEPPPPAPETPPPGAPDAASIDAPPMGRVGDVDRWVGDDKARARIALDAELAGRNRPTLVALLESRLA